VAYLISYKLIQGITHQSAKTDTHFIRCICRHG